MLQLAPVIVAGFAYIMSQLGCSRSEEIPPPSTDPNTPETPEPSSTYVVPTTSNTSSPLGSCVAPSTSEIARAEADAYYQQRAEFIQTTAGITADFFDGSFEWTLQKQVALGYVTEQYAAFSDEILRQPQTINFIQQKCLANFNKLKNLKPEPAVVYIDFSGFEKIYNQKLHSKTGLSFEDWKTKVKSKLEKLYTNQSGKRVNIEFVFSKPKNGNYIPVFVTPESFSNFLNGHKTYSKWNDTASTHLVGVQPGLGQTIFNPQKASEQNGGEIRPRIKSQTDGFIFISGERFGYILSVDDVSQNRAISTVKNGGDGSPFDFAWSHNNPSEGFADVFAFTIAHEVGHALGFAHTDETVILSRNVDRSNKQRWSTIMDDDRVRCNAGIWGFDTCKNFWNKHNIPTTTLEKPEGGASRHFTTNQFDFMTLAVGLK